jgi:outer membrane protein W
MLLLIILFYYVGGNASDSNNSILINASYLLTTGEEDLNNTMGFGFLYNRNFTDKLSLSTGLYYFSPSNEANNLPSGNIKLLPIIINGNYTFGGETFYPYISAGLSYFILNYSLSSDTIKAFDELGFDLSSSADNSLGFNIGGGTYIKLNTKYDLIIDVRYFNASSTISATIKERVTQLQNEKSINISLNSIAISGGIKFNF